MSEYFFSNLKHVALVGLGPDRELSRQSPAEQVWGVNALNLFQPVDVIFNMHDMRKRAPDADLTPEMKQAWDGLDKARDDNIPVISCYEIEGYPNVRAFPIERVVEAFRIDYFTCTSAYMLAFAIGVGVNRMDIFGITGKEAYQHQIPCLSFWLGQAMGRGIDVRTFGYGSDLLRTQPSLSAPVSRQHRYGYDQHPLEAKEFLEGVVGSPIAWEEEE